MTNIRSVLTCCLFFVTLICPVIANAVSEDILVDEYRDKIYPYFSSTFEGGWFAGVGGKKIRYSLKKSASEKVAIVVVSGRTEHITKYAEFFYDFKDLGYSFFIYDHRGQGSSERLLNDPH